MVQNDIAIIRLEQRIARSTNIDWLCLPTEQSRLADQDLLKVVAYQHEDEHSLQRQLDVRVQHSPNTQIQCQYQLTNIAEDAFCTLSTEMSSYLGVVSIEPG
jgi:hypothetical protein